MRFARYALVLLVAASAALPALSQDPLTAFPKNYHLVLDNPTVEVIRVHYGPHERVGVHDHSSFPTIYVYPSDSGPVRFAHDENPPFALTRPSIIKGSFRVSPGRAERHTVENLSDTSSDFLRVELKQIPLGSGLPPFRGKPPEERTSGGSSTEYRSSRFTVERIVCNAADTCRLPHSELPSLLIAFSPIKLSGSSEIVASGDVRWEQGQQAASVRSASGEPAHLLKITFLPLGN